MISPVQSNDPWRQSRRYQKSIKVGRICWKGRVCAWSERVNEQLMLKVVVMTVMDWQLDKWIRRWSSLLQRRQPISKLSATNGGWAQVRRKRVATSPGPKHVTTLSRTDMCRTSDLNDGCADVVFEPDWTSSTDTVESNDCHFKQYPLA